MQPGPPDGDSTRPQAWQHTQRHDWPGGPAGPPLRSGASTQSQRERPRHSARRASFVILLVAGLCGLAVSVFGVAHQLLPRQFTAAQQRQIVSWELSRRWRALPAGQIFPATVDYQLPAGYVFASRPLELSAQRLGISTATDCARSLAPAAARIVGQLGCAALMRATYADSSGSMVATMGIAVLPSAKAALAAVRDLAAEEGDHAELLSALPVAHSLAGEFSDRQRQLSTLTAAGPYVIFSTAGFSDGRPLVRISTDSYLEHEMVSLADGLARAASRVLGSKPPQPRCPGAPGC